MSMKDRLEMATNIVVIIVACIIGAYFVKERLAPATPPVFSLKVGDHLRGLSAYDWKAHDRTLVLVLRKGCRYCEDSMPFYRKLTDLEKSGRIDAHLIAVLPDDAAAVQQLAQAEQLPVEWLPSIALDQLKVRVTPTLILADRQGSILKVWVGELTASGETDLIAAISRLGN
jgi:hypothetical protein